MSGLAKRALLVMTNRSVSKPLVERLEAAGWTATVVETVEGLKTSLGKGSGAGGEFQAAFLDVCVTADAASKLITLLRRSLPKTCRLVVADDFLDPNAMAALERADVCVRLGVPSSDPEPIAVALLQRGMPAGAAAVRYDVNVINCFVSSAEDVLEYYVGAKPEHGRATVVLSKRVPAGFVAAVVEFTGEQGGAASLSCEKAFVIDIASRINGTSKREAEVDTAALVQAVEEMADQIFGKTEILLGKLGYQLSIGAPQVRMSEDEDLELRGKGPVMIIPFTMKGKKFYVGFSLNTR